MRTWVRRARGAVATGITWAAAWSAVGSVPRWVLGIETDAPLPLIFGVLGLLAGVVFSAVLMATEGRRRFDEMSMRRFAAWGATGGLLLSALFARIASLGLADVLMLAPTLAGASAICAAGSLAIARRSVARPLLDGGEIASAVEVADGEKLKLRGGDE